MRPGNLVVVVLLFAASRAHHGTRDPGGGGHRGPVLALQQPGGTCSAPSLIPEPLSTGGRCNLRDRLREGL